MKRTDFSFDLPDDLIATVPAPQRTGSRLLALDRLTGALRDHHFPQVLDVLQCGDLLVFNDTRVIPARMFGQKMTGGKLEVLVERILSPQSCLAHMRASKSPKPGSQILIDGIPLAVVARHEALFELVLDPLHGTLFELMQQSGHMPLPPYIERPDELSDQERYQTVYARHPGAVAAPTAGLHFDDALLERLREKGVNFAYTTLHVGAGTFQPVKADDILEHRMHSEWLRVGAETVDLVRDTKARGKRVWAVGTTSVRSLETAAREGDIQPFEGDTNIFIYPGYEFRVIDGLITNFHLPESTLIMLVSAFAGREHTLAAYAHAIRERYRFYSYGDAMLIAPDLVPDAAQTPPFSKETP